MSALTATKKRRKSELNANPQIMGCRNKCLNEKRRREQENIYIEELAELISASIADMSALSVKPDKCAILQETVNQIRRIKASEEAVQQGEVSSSTTILANEILCPLVLEALDGFLFVVNTEGKVEFVSENVQSFINFQQSDILHQTIYNIIHVGDHARFSGNLLPMSIGWAGGDSKTQRSFNMRIRVKSEAEHFENMQISAIQMPRDSEENCLVCIARRLPPNERPVGAPVEQFTTKLLRNGTVIGLDVSGLSDIYKQHLPKNLVGTLLQELCHQQDLQKLVSHLQDALSQGSSTSSLYKIRMGPEKFVQIQTKSKFFAFKSSTEPGFIMATHTIVNTETDDSEKPQQSVQQQLVPNTDSKSPNSDTNNNSEDTQSDVLSAPRQSQQQVPNASQCNSSQSSFATFQLQSEIDLNLDALWPSDLDSSPSGLGTSQTQPVHPSPIGGSPAQPSLAATWGVQGSPSSMYVSPQYGFAYSPQVVKEEESDAQVQSNTSGGDRLRNLLTNSPQQATGANMQPPKQENKILKGLLNAEDESAEGTGPNNMLLQLLNKDTAEPKKGAELLQQLLNSNQDDNRSPRGMKRPYVEEPPLPGTSRNPPGDLCKKNPRLVNLLKIRPDNQPIPQIPPDILQSVPNEKLRVVKDNQANWPRPRAPVAHSSPSLQSLLNQQTPSQDMRRPQMLQAAVRPTQQQQQQFILPSTSATSAGDDILSEIIDQVLEFVPETSQFRDNDPVLPIFEEASVPSNSNELAMIDAIQKELMECEHAVQFSTSPATQQSQQLQINQQAQQVMMSRGLFPQMQAPNGQPMDQFSQPLYIQRTTTTTTTLAGRLAGRGPPNVIAPGSPQQQLTPQQQQLLQQQLQQRRKQQLIQQQQQALQSQQIPQQLLQQSQQVIGQQLQHQQGNRPITLDSLLNTNAPPPNVTLPRDGMSPINQMGMRPNQANQFSQMRAQFQGQQPGVMQQQQQQQRWAATQQANPQLLQQAARMGVQQRNPMLNAQLSGGHAGTGHVVGTAQQQYSPLQSPGQNQVQPQMQQGNLQQQPQLQQMQFDEFGNFPQQVRQQRPPQQVIPNNSEVLRKSLGDLVRARSAAAAATGGGIMGQSGNTINTGDRGGLVISGGGIVPSNNVVGGNGAGVPDLEALGISFDVKEQGGGSLYY